MTEDCHIARVKTETYFVGWCRQHSSLQVYPTISEQAAAAAAQICQQ